ncbi:hypothetical protein TNCT_166011 [Trichonephila clavata]|uniref:Uncharacterized protein n=1 Tax=Trichonephila clavata TaxID=2740835 RepID=A0A8X6LRY8_TRICU|nr:hypothetical protein TNCT_166011 [Trichonephila clavata]
MEIFVAAGIYISLLKTVTFHAKPSTMNDLEAMEASHIVQENVKLDVSSFHAWIKCFECLLHISYRLDIKKWSARKTGRPEKDFG